MVVHGGYAEPVHWDVSSRVSDSFHERLIGHGSQIETAEFVYAVNRLW